MKRIIQGIMFSWLSLMAVAWPAAAQSSEDDRLAAFYKNYLEQYFQQQPLAATQLGDHRFDRLLDDISPAARAQWRELLSQTLKAMHGAVN